MVIIPIFPLLLIAYNLHYTQRDHVIKQHLSHLRVVFKQTVETIDTHIHYQKQLLSNIASMPKIAEQLNNKKKGVKNKKKINKKKQTIKMLRLKTTLPSKTN